MVDSYFDNHKEAKGFLFDGFPRTVAQAKALDHLLGVKKTSISMVLILAVDEKELLKRLILRGKTSGRSDDADETILRSRQDVYKRETLPVADYYSKTNKVKNVDGMGGIDEIFERLCSQIDNKMK
jgi:adenylate kinase